MFGQSISGGVDMDSNGYPGMSATGEMQQQAEQTAKRVVCRLLAPAVAGGWWSWAFSSISPLLFEAPDENLSWSLNLCVWAVMMDWHAKAEDSC